MADKKKRKKKKLTVTEKRRKNLIRAIKRAEGDYGMDAYMLVQIASPQKIRSLSENRNKRLHALSYTAGGEKKAEKELEKQIERLNRKNAPQEPPIGGDDVFPEPPKPPEPPIGGDDEGSKGTPGEGDDTNLGDDFSFADLGETYYQNLMDEIKEKFGSRGKGETGKRLQDEIDKLVDKYGKDEIMSIIGRESAEFHDAAQDIIYYMRDEEVLDGAIRVLEEFFEKYM